MPALPDDLTRAKNILRAATGARSMLNEPLSGAGLQSTMTVVATQVEELAALAVRMLTPSLSSEAAPPALGSVERLNQEFAAVQGRNAELEETLTEIRNALRAWDSYDPNEPSASIVGRLIDRTRVLHTQIDRAYEELRPFALTQPPP